MSIVNSTDTSKSLTIISVVYASPRFFDANLDLTKRLNPGFNSRWIVVDNRPASDRTPFGGDGIEVLPGVPDPTARDSGSLHHALALEKALARVRTRFVLLLDHDFYVIRRDWVADVLSHVDARRIDVFGSVWNPHWYYQYRDFPSVHFMLVDLDRIPAAAIDLKPSIGTDRWWRLINRRSLPWPTFLRDTLKAGRCRDTGWQFYRRYGADPGIRVETLVPHYLPPNDARRRFEEALGPVLPSSWRKYPADRRSYAEESFLKTCWPQAYEQGWEEFFWQGDAFAVHLRRVGRAMARKPLEQDGALLRGFIETVTD